MEAFIIKVNGRRVDEVVFLKPHSVKEVKAILIAEGYKAKGLTVHKTVI